MTEQNPHPPGFWGSPYSIGLIVMGVAAGYYMLTEHRTHVVSALPWLLFVSCPLMHFFMHHGKHDGGQKHDHDHQQGPRSGA